MFSRKQRNLIGEIVNISNVLNNDYFEWFEDDQCLEWYSRKTGQHGEILVILRHENFESLTIGANIDLLDWSVYERIYGRCAMNEIQFHEIYKKDDEGITRISEAWKPYDKRWEPKQ